MSVTHCCFAQLPRARHRSARTAWSRFKEQVAVNTENLSAYGAIKDPATDILLTLAERWAEERHWTVTGQ